ncbi:type II secretion system protein GspE [Yersinia nurmii]|uniref:Type II secretion system protein GspE n=1 Tax=Yersinia nurmii TaxID=685706 RepID=A0AAW7K8M3_9GAMM|nr:type II secretion system protein GspE [Yersinia nurmii]MDN0088134.1 type II secretion system protein GspE [Yersinia nurmii]
MNSNRSINNKGAGDALSRLCQQYRAIPLEISPNTLTLAMLQYPTSEEINALRFACGLNVEVILWPAAKIEHHLHHLSPDLIQQLNGAIRPDNEIKKHAEEAAIKYAPDTDKSHIQAFDNQKVTSLNDESDAPIINIIHQTLRMAIQKRASDVHFEPYRRYYRIRLRIDGILHQTLSPPANLVNRINACLKVMAKLNSAERRLPQDGQFSISLDNHYYSLRIATLPTQYGEKVVLRILNTNIPQRLDELELPQKSRESILEALSLPQGLILVTGPTGSGKTVTLYSCLQHLNQQYRNLCSVEDPIEIPVEGINQTQTNSKIDLDFSQALRALLRQDPDVIMIGEIRDNETADIAVRAALTGHLVLSTLHTNSTQETLARLTQMGISHYLLASCLKLVVAQRLVRRLCQRCKRAAPEPVILPIVLCPKPLHHWHATGCEHCSSGYYGRIGVYDTWAMTPSNQQDLMNIAPLPSLKNSQPPPGHHSLLIAGLALVQQGITSIAEVSRVVGNLTTLRGIQ